MIRLLLSLSIASTPCRSNELSPAELDERLAAAEAAVETHEQSLMLWFGSVFGLHAAVLAGSIVIANATDDDGTKKEMYVAAFGSGLGIATLLTSVPPMVGASAAAGGVADRRERLALLENILERSAKKIDFTQSWLAHAASFAYSLGASLVLWLAFDRERAAITQLLGGQAIGQGRILVQPTGARNAWSDYKHRFLGGCGEPPPAASAVEIEPAGMGFTLRF